jgi:hypothetical protein
MIFENITLDNKNQEQFNLVCGLNKNFFKNFKKRLDCMTAI